MSLSDAFGRAVALIGGGDDPAAAPGRRATQPAMGSAPAIPAARPQGSIPTLKMPTARGWAAGRRRSRRPGSRSTPSRPASKHPRWIHVLPNGDVLSAEALTVPGPAQDASSTTRWSRTMQRAAAVGVSPNRITLLRDADGDGVAEIRETFLDGLNQPFGMALLGDTFYVGNTDGVVAFPYTAGPARITAPGRRLVDVQARRALDAQPAAEPRRAKLYVGVGSLSNIGEQRHGGRGGPRRHLRARPRERHAAASSPRACATRWAWPGSRAPACSGPWSTSATASATRRRPTT